MRITIGRKLIGGFMIMALLVLIAGAVGFIVLGNVSHSADIVAKEKTPVRYAVLNAALALERVQSAMANFIHVKTYSASLEEAIHLNMDEFFMWIATIQYGTDSKEFSDSPAGKRYQDLGLVVVVPQSSEGMRLAAEKIYTEGQQFNTYTQELVAAQKNYTHYTVSSQGKAYELDAFLNLAQRDHLEWIKELKDAVNIETKFTGDTELNQGLVGHWLQTYRISDAAFMKLMEKFNKQFVKLRGLSKKINEQAKYKDKARLLNRGLGATARMDGYFKKMHAHIGQVYAQLFQHKGDKIQALRSSAEAINGEINNLIGLADQEMGAALSESSSMYRTGSLILVGITIVAALIGALLGIYISRIITRNVQRLGETTKKVAQGDLKNTVDIRTGDEIGDLAEDTNQMIDDLRSIIGRIRTFAGSLTDASKKLASISGDLDTNAVNMNELSSNAVHATDEMNTSMASINDTSQESMSNVRTVAAAIEEMTATITEVSSNAAKGRSVTAEAVSTVNQTSDRMNELGSAAEAIGKVVELIMDISEQTNLLALNATIEAARAGEAGKGFAVVASEVKELARQANEASEDIRQKTGAIQSSSKSTISEIQTISEVMQDVNSIVESIAAAVEEQAVTTKQISENVHFVTTGIEGVTADVTSATEVTQTVAHDVGVVSQVSQDVRKGSSQIRSSAGALADLADELQKTVEQFSL